MTKHWNKFLLSSAAALAFTASQAYAQSAEGTGEEIIVTGTRTTGMTQSDSLTPIRVLGEEALEAVGQPSLDQALTQLVPSFTAQAFGGDTANLTLSARLRGLSPNHTLVLVNGKRRHGTANLAVLSSPFQGSAAPDLDLIAPIAVSRVEVLEQGAAAQYGSDAIAGVVNLILKDNSEGGAVSATYGEHYDTGGQTYAFSGNLGAPLGENGFINLSIFNRFQDFTQVGGLDRRVTDQNGVLLSSLSPARQALYANIPGFPFVNRINGSAQSRLTTAVVNAEYDLTPEISAYGFGTYSQRTASSYQNIRLPDRIIGSPTLGVAGTLGAPGSVVFDPDGDNPSNGFNPREAIEQVDGSITGGVSGDYDNFTFDFSTTFGRDKNEVYTLDSANVSLYIDTRFTPRNFFDGTFENSEWTVNADFTRTFELGLTSPVTLAWGAEYRENKYQIGSGDPASIYKEGGQAYPGFRPSDAGDHSRNNTSLYVDVAFEPLADLNIDAAIRYEDYSDFGSETIWKLTGRYDFNEAFAVRGTVSTGFRAPTLAEQFYSATNVSPTAAFVQLPANSAAAKQLGFQNLEPETSETISAGFVFRPIGGLVVTVDAYEVKVDDRILGTGSIFGSGGAINFPAVTAAIIANGNVLDPTVSQTGITIFTNGANTRTRGVDILASYPSSFGAFDVDWSLAATWNETDLVSADRAPASLNGITLFNPTSIGNLTTASPRFKVIAGADIERGPFGGNIRAAWYGETSNQFSPNGGIYYEQTVPSEVIIDLEASYQPREFVTFSIGANNVFDERPPTIDIVPGSTNNTLVNGGNVLDAPLGFSPYGINGGYYYARILVEF